MPAADTAAAVMAEWDCRVSQVVDVNMGIRKPVADAFLYEALGGQNAEFGFGEIEPAAVFRGIMPFEALNQTAGFRGRKGLIE